jgi:hypothetical protein
MRAFLVLLFATSALGQSPGPGLNALPEVEFTRLSQRDPNPLGVKALAIRPEQWKHGETDHFIYHFVDSFVATAVSVEAEFHYRVVAKELRREEPPGDVKSHIYIFQKPADWQQFQSAGKLEPWTGGIQSQGSLFIVRDPSFKFSDNSLGHEIAHLIIHRYYPDGIPTWLNEGFAQFVSKGAQASFLRARNYNAKPLSQPILAANFIPLAMLTTMSWRGWSVSSPRPTKRRFLFSSMRSVATRLLSPRWRRLTARSFPASTLSRKNSAPTPRRAR